MKNVWKNSTLPQIAFACSFSWTLLHPLLSSSSRPSKWWNRFRPFRTLPHWNLVVAFLCSFSVFPQFFSRRFAIELWPFDRTYVWQKKKKSARQMSATFRDLTPGKAFLKTSVRVGSVIVSLSPLVYFQLYYYRDDFCFLRIIICENYYWRLFVAQQDQLRRYRNMWPYFTLNLCVIFIQIRNFEIYFIVCSNLAIINDLRLLAMHVLLWKTIAIVFCIRCLYYIF